MISRALLFVSVLIAIVFSLSAPALAVDLLNPVCNTTSTAANSKPELCKDNNAHSANDPIFGSHGILALIVNVLSFIGGFFAVIFITIAALRLILSTGDSTTVTESRQAIIYSLVGLVIIAAAQLIVRFVIERVKK